MPARDILILVSNMKVQGQALTRALTTAGVQFESPRDESFLDTDVGRLVLAVLRIVCTPQDYVAHRILLGLMPRTSVNTTAAIASAVVQNNQNFRDIFYQQPAPTGFNARAMAAINAVRGICAQITGWQGADTLAQRQADLDGIVGGVFGAQGLQDWQAFCQLVPAGITLEELKSFLWTDTSEQQAALLETVYERLGQPLPAGGVLPPRVRIMTMHGAKGLSAKVVFIPGLEEQVLPGPYRQRNAGLVSEAARLLYVSITRARAACILSFADRRTVNGRSTRHVASRFTNHVAGAFARRTGGLTAAEVQQVTQDIANL